MHIGLPVKDIAPFVAHLTVAMLAVSYVYYCWRTKVPIFPTERSAQQALLALLRETVARRPDGKLKIYDLGAGGGGLCLAIARALPQAQVIGIEISWPAWLFAVLRQKILRQKNLDYRRADFWTADLAEADIVICYLGDILMPRLREKLEQTPKAGRLIISNTFPIPQWEPLQIIRVPAILSKQLLVYVQHDANAH